MVTMEASSTTMSWAITTTARIDHRRGSGSCEEKSACSGAVISLIVDLPMVRNGLCNPMVWIDSRSCPAATHAWPWLLPHGPCGGATRPTTRAFPTGSTRAVTEKCGCEVIHDTQAMLVVWVSKMSSGVADQVLRINSCANNDLGNRDQRRGKWLR